MNHFSKVATLTVCVIAAVALSCATARTETVDRIVANVNGEIILYSDLQEQIKLQQKQTPSMDLSDPEKRSKAEHEVLTQLIRQKLTDAEIDRLKVVVNQPEVEATIKQIADENHTNLAQFEEKLKANGLTMQKFREQIRKNMERNRLMERVLTSKVLITDKQVEAYLSGADGDSAITSQKVRLGLILLPVGEKTGKPAEVEKTGREILGKLKNGADFRAMAKQYSKGPAADDGGDIGYMAAEELAPYIAQAIKNLKKDEISDLVQGPGGFYILKIIDFESKKLSKSDPATREKVRRSLFDREVNRRFEEWVHDLESKAFIQISL
jgi:peptidyl-prolyl cis-trans isomerase SurA